MYLNGHTYFSLKYGIMSPEDLLHEAQQKGITSLAITDINNTSGVLDFCRLAPRYNIKPVIGIDFRNGAQQQFVTLAKNIEGFRELNDFLSHHLHTGEKFPARAPKFQQAYVIYPLANILELQTVQPRILKTLRNNEFIGIAAHQVKSLHLGGFKNYMHKLVMLFPVTFRSKTDFNLHRLLRAIDNNTLLSKVPLTENAQADEVMLHKYELIKLYGDYPQMIDNTMKLLDTCNIDFEFGKNKNKKTFTGNVYEDKLLLEKLCSEGLKYRYEKVNAEITERYEKEINLITDMGFASYFLINYDIVRYAQSKNYFYVGRGSGANSLVAYLLRITDVDPIDLDLYFERFMNEYRINPPDFDLDFSWKDRDDIQRYIFETHTRHHVALLATYSTFQWDASVRELGKVFGLPKAEIDKFFDEAGQKSEPDNIGKLILKYGKMMIDMPNHLSIHAGGVLISERPIHYYTATHIPPKGFPTTQFSMLEAEDVGLYKFDILSQRGLGHIKDTVELVKKNQGIEIDIHNVKQFKKDERVKQLIRTGRCMGCFYVESPAMRGLLKKLRVDTYLGLVAASSIIRPGVARSGMMREYITRVRDPQKATYIHPLMKEFMQETYGVMVYQEDVIKVAHYFAGLTLAEADMLRRGMSGKFRGREEFMKIKTRFFEGCREKNHNPKVSEEVWRQIESFAGYAFSKGHSASYAVESYQSLYLKAYYPKEFMVGVINNFGGFYRTEFYVHEARMSGATVHAPHINKSDYTTSISGNDVYLGFIHIGELERNVADDILNERNLHGIFSSLEDFMKRVNISVEQLRILIRIGAFRFTGRTKKQLLWDIHTIIGAEKKTDVHAELFEPERKNFKLPVLHQHRLDDALDEIEILGFPLCSPFELIKGERSEVKGEMESVRLRPLGTGCAEANDVEVVINQLPSALADGKKVNTDYHALPLALADSLPQYFNKEIAIVGYLVTTKSTRTKNGDYMFFGTFIDSEGYFFDTTHFPAIAAKYPLRGRGSYHIKGRVDNDFDYYTINVSFIERLDEIVWEDLV